VLFLASQSPRRRQLLEQLGVEYSVLDVDIPEVPQPGEGAEGYVRRVAREKAGAGFVQVAGTPRAVVLAADTEVVLEGRVYGKPRDAADAVEMLLSLAGRTHLVLSAVCCMDGGREHEVLSRSEVRFAALDRARIEAYVATGEPLGRAGAYAVQGRAAAFIEHLAGSFSGVMGLPLYETAGLLRRFGIACP
jgi:septum formation protein